MNFSCRMLPALLLVVALGCGKSPTSPTNQQPGNTNRAPVIGSMTVSPTFGVSGLTLITMNASATDADGDAVTYSWSFSGTTASGASTSAKLTGNGSVTVQLTVSDGRGGTATDSRTVTVGTMTGDWTLTVPGVCGTDPRETNPIFTLTQTGTVVTGALNFPGNWCNASPGTHSEIPQASPGSIDDQGNFALPRVAIGSFGDFRLANGKMDSTGRKVTGQIFNSGFVGETFIMTKK